MASIFSHALLAVTIGKSYSRKYTSWKFYLLGAFCAMIPDADVVMFRFGIPYDHIWGHRGFTHSLLFALLLGIAVTLIFYRNLPLLSRQGIIYATFFFLCTSSHSLLDAMTSGGLGVAVFAPFDNNRYFLPWRPIQVSPIGVDNFFSEWGLRVIKSEILWITVPCISYMLAMEFVGRKNRKAPQKKH